MTELRLPDAPHDLAERLESGGAIAWREPVTMLTYEPAAPERYPMFLDRRVYQGSSGRVYPIPFVDSISPTGSPRAWDAVHLENEWIRVMVMPELGGRIHVGFDKKSGYDFFYRNPVIKPALVGLAGPWIAGGVELNWPQHHRPATFDPVQVHIEQHDDGAVTVWCSDHDPFTRMKGMHGVRLHPDRAAVELVVRLHNRTSEVQTFLWWANVAAKVHDDYQSFFPTDVHWVADHARRAITSFPRADRPYYGVDYPAAGRAHEGADRLDWYRNIPVPTSYMVLGSRDDFFGGYDHSADAGFVHVADRRIAPGKKQWTWGNAAFGRAWDRLLSDDGAPYVELMAGVYTDNQPDFSWLQPGETKTFSQSWYPIQRIGVVQQANTEAAIHLEVADGRAELGVCVTTRRGAASVTLERDGLVVYRWAGALEPGEPHLATVDVPGGALTLIVRDGEEELLRWTPREDAAGPEPEPATAPLAPTDISSSDELYLTGVHLMQYRHPTRAPEPYWEESLRRDPGDSRSALALAESAFRRTDYARAERLVRASLARLTLRNGTPADGSAHYLLGLVLARTGRVDEALDAFGRAGWDGWMLAPASVEMSRLLARRGDVAEALDRATRARRANPGDSRAVVLEIILLRRSGRAAEAASLLAAQLAVDPLDQTVLAIDGRAGTTDQRTLLDVARDLAAAGETAAALRVLDAAIAGPRTGYVEARPVLHYAKAMLLEGEVAAEQRRLARDSDTAWCFPAGADDHDALRAAIAADPTDDTAHTLLATLLHDRGRTTEALELWLTAIDLGRRDAVTFRNAAVALVGTGGDRARAFALYGEALALRPHDARLWYESDQLLTRLGAGDGERLERLERRRDVVDLRDDLTVEYLDLLVSTGRAAEAHAVLSGRSFAPWEGGEWRVLGAWDRACLALAGERLANGDAEGSLSFALAALDPPVTLGEARHPLDSVAHIDLARADALDALGRAAEASEARARAAAHPTAQRPELGAPVDYFATSLPDLLLFPAVTAP